ncbi:AraC family transcriptional regulator [Neorhizobium sp. Rsf11]|uniref:AraC family transcriptional regulator n=2 Tax=Neorhizobium TaxID=1525371 RepID=A0ABV0MBZ2_9HYPH|nr:AraC family transcriptional regulator [Neorhizobium petrolearium]MCC2613720.1 AraC family transcriptional regulator [Neorhizobium petrolearium]WGI72032.1 AraC family transcriptional regulator [Neorhizobium petrolearium]
MDWLSRLLALMPVAGRLDLRCHYGAPWRIDSKMSEPGVAPYHIVLSGKAVMDDPAGGAPICLEAGDILLLPAGAAHVLHDGSAVHPPPARYRPALNHTISENDGEGKATELLCGHFTVSHPHYHVIHRYLPSRLIVRRDRVGQAPSGTGAQLDQLVSLMKAETHFDGLGGSAMLNALSSALFALTLRRASEQQEAPTGLLALAGYPRIAPALSAMLSKPAHAWTLSQLANVCNMSRASLARHFADKLGHSAIELLLDIRIGYAANALRVPGTSTAAVAEDVGYRSEAAFQRVFKQKMGVTPAQWRRAATAIVPSPEIHEAQSL